jgi:hypothetical protein
VIAGIFVELAGNDGAAEFRQSGPICAKVGTIALVIRTFIVAVVAHWPDVGVKV